MPASADLNLWSTASVSLTTFVSWSYSHKEVSQPRLFGIGLISNPQVLKLRILP